MKTLSSEAFSVFSSWLLVKILVIDDIYAHFTYSPTTTKLHSLAASQEWVGTHE
nr:MAG TPA: hypothetical protein [Caudoviricetes sp.]